MCVQAGQPIHSQHLVEVVAATGVAKVSSRAAVLRIQLDDSLAVNVRPG